MYLDTKLSHQGVFIVAAAIALGVASCGSDTASIAVDAPDSESPSTVETHADITADASTDVPTTVGPATTSAPAPTMSTTTTTLAPATTTTSAPLPGAATGGVSGPVVFSKENRSETAEEALASGTLELVDSCLVLASPDEQSTLVVWPLGTTWDEQREIIVARSGTEFRSGQFIELGGGFRSPATVSGFVTDPDALEVIEDCVANELISEVVFVAQHQP